MIQKLSQFFGFEEVVQGVLPVFQKAPIQEAPGKSLKEAAVTLFGAFLRDSAENSTEEHATTNTPPRINTLNSSL